MEREGPLPLDVVPNVRIERRVRQVPLDGYADFFRQSVLSDSTAVLHNADLLPQDFDAPVSVTWHRVDDDKPLTEKSRLVPSGASYALEQNAIFVMTEIPGGARLREKVEAVCVAGDRALIVNAQSGRLAWLGLGPELDAHIRAVWKKD